MCLFGWLHDIMLCYTALHCKMLPCYTYLGPTCRQERLFSLGSETEDCHNKLGRSTEMYSARMCCPVLLKENSNLGQKELCVRGELLSRLLNTVLRHPVWPNLGKSLVVQWWSGRPLDSKYLRFRGCRALCCSWIFRASVERDTEAYWPCESSLNSFRVISCSAERAGRARDLRKRRQGQFWGLCGMGAAKPGRVCGNGGAWDTWE